MPPKTRRLRLPELRIQPAAGSLVLGTQIRLIGTSPESPGACGYVQERDSEDEQDCFWRRIIFFLRCHYLALWGRKMSDIFDIKEMTEEDIKLQLAIVEAKDNNHSSSFCLQYV